MKLSIHGKLLILCMLLLDKSVEALCNKHTNVTKTSNDENIKTRNADSNQDRYVILERIPSDVTSFTQGITYGSNKKLYMSTGMYGESKLREIDASDATIILQNKNLNDKFFGEGLAYYGNRKLIQITWKSQTGFVYKVRKNGKFRRVRKFKFQTLRNEGWGITHDQKNNRFIVSDGSTYLHFWNDKTLTEIDRIQVVRENGSTVNNLNELELIQGLVFANIWYSNVIVVIDPETGVVVDEIDFSNLVNEEEEKNNKANVLNGISVFDGSDVLITGKYYSTIYRIQLLDYM